MGWGGVGWGGVKGFCSTATPYTKCSCTSTHSSCYAAGCFPALPHIRHAMLLDVLLYFHTYVMLRCWMFSCAPTHTSCYAAGCSLALALPHIRHATLLDVLVHFHTYVMRRCWMFSCTSTHASCVLFVFLFASNPRPVHLSVHWHR